MYDLSRNVFSGLGGMHYRFPSPWNDASSVSMPTSWLKVLEWCEFLYYREPTLSKALGRVIAFFLTELDVESSDRADDEDLGDDERIEWTDTFESLRYKEALTEVDQNFIAYGNAYVALQIPIAKRLLMCPKCRNAFPCRDVVTRSEFALDFSNYEFNAHCPVCRTGAGFSGPFWVTDTYEDDPKKFVIKCFSPKEIEIIPDLWTGRADYKWRIPEDYKLDIRRRVPVVLENVHPEVLKAMKNRHTHFLFDPDYLFHMKEPTLAGIRNRGVGFPRFFTQFRDIWHVQVIRRANEALAMDYLVPIRIISPEARSGAPIEGGAGIDPMLSINGSSFAASMRSIIERHRYNPTDYHVSTTPVKYQILSGDGKQFVAKDLIEQAQEIMLNSAGVPMDFYRGTIQLQAMPGSLRLLEQTWAFMIQQNNRLLTWMASKIGRIQGWRDVNVTLRRTLFTEDVQKQLALLQLNMAGKVSDSTAFQQFGIIDSKYEKRKLLEEQRDTEELTAKIQKEMEQTSFGDAVASGQIGPNGQPVQQPGAAPGGAAPGAAPPGGAPPGAGGMQMPIGPPPPGMSPQDMEGWASAKADELLMKPEALKDSELRALSQQDKFLHTLVKTKMDERRNQLRLAGGAMLMGQGGGQPPPA